MSTTTKVKDIPSPMRPHLYAAAVKKAWYACLIDALLDDGAEGVVQNLTFYRTRSGHPGKQY